MYYIKTDEEVMFVAAVKFIKVSETSGSYISATEKDYQGVVVNGEPLSVNVDNPIAGLKTAIFIDQKDWNETVLQEYEKFQLEYNLPLKLEEISVSCSATINNGTQVQLSDGTTKQFSYTIEDQSNISEMFVAVMVGATEYPYHADGEDCVIYSAQDIIAIYSTLTGFKTAQTTYHNQLKAYIQSLDNAQDVMAVQYGQELTGEYLEKYNQLMAVAQEQMEIILSKLTQPTN